jgi:hypothetical protein
LFGGYFPGNEPRFKLKRMGHYSLSLSRRRAGGGGAAAPGLPEAFEEIPKGRKPSPAALFERVDLSRKRER